MAKELLTVKDFSDLLIKRVKRHVVLGSSNFAEDLIRTEQWVAILDNSLMSFVDALGFKDDVFRETTTYTGITTRALSADVSYAGNCGKLSTLALVYAAQHEQIKNFEIKVCKLEPMDHVLLEITELATGDCIHCDPWLGRTFTGDKHEVIGEIAPLYLARKQDLLALHKQHEHSQRFWSSPPDDTGLQALKLGQTQAAQMLFNIAMGYKHEREAWDAFQHYQKAPQGHCPMSLSPVPDWSNFTLNETTAPKILKLFDFLRLLSLSPVYPNSEHLKQKQIRAIETMEKEFGIHLDMVLSQIKSVEALQWWLERGVAPDYFVTCNGLQLLHQVYDIEERAGYPCIDVLRSAGADINAIDSEGDSLLFVSVYEGNIELFDKLLGYEELDVGQKNGEKQSVFEALEAVINEGINKPLSPQEGCEQLQPAIEMLNHMYTKYSDKLNISSSQYQALVTQYQAIAQKRTAVTQHSGLKK